MGNLKLPKVIIKSNGAFTNISIDGKEITGVRSVEFMHDREKKLHPVLRISLLTDQVTIDSPAMPELPEVYRPHYVSVDALINAGVLTPDRLSELLEQGAL